MAKSHKNTPKEAKHKINDQIKANEVRLIGDGEPEIMLLSQALDLADEAELDLVLINDNATPPVVKIMDYTKYIYELNRNKPQVKNKPVKEVRLTPNTGENDLAFKLKHIISFLEGGHKVKVYVQFKGREITFVERGKIVLLKLVTDVEEYGTIESMPQLEGKKLMVLIKPKTKK